MPKQKDLKRLVRERMARTGESYTAARAQVLRSSDDRRDYAALAGMKDASVKAKTGRDWRSWVAVLDEAGARSKPHPEIVKVLLAEHDVTHWWAQSITVAYERIRGLREKGRRRGGGYDVNKSKTLPVPIAELYAAFGARRRKAWLGDAKPRVKTATREKSMRLAWEDGTSVDVNFWEKGPAKSQVQLQHRGLADKTTAENLRVYWTERLRDLTRVLVMK